MSRIRALAAVGAAAFLLRAGAAVLTETRPLFPAYYYTDAQLVEAWAAKSRAAGTCGAPPGFDGTRSQLMLIETQLALDRLLGPHPLAPKLFNALLGALACAALGAALWPVFGAGPALTAAALCAAWPSNVFFTSQNFKEAPTNLLAILAIWGFLTLLDGGAAGAAAALVAAGVALALLLGAFYRAYVLLVLVAAMAASAVWAAARRRSPAFALAGLAAVAATLALYAPASRWLMARWLGPARAEDRGLVTQLVPRTWDDRYTPTSPAGIAAFRRDQQKVDADWARDNRRREIATQLFPDARFATWGDVAAFLPKGIFYVLFMPLPGLYPLGGKPGRWAAALENLALLALAGVGLAGAARGPKNPSRLFLLLFFAGMAAGSGLLEPDLGSAARHKLLYLPMLFPFAVEELRRLRRPRGSPRP